MWKNKSFPCWTDTFNFVLFRKSRIWNSLVPGSAIFIQQKDTFSFYNTLCNKQACLLFFLLGSQRNFPVGFSPSLVSGKPQQRSLWVKQLSPGPAPRVCPLSERSDAQARPSSVGSRGRRRRLEARGFPGKILPPSSAWWKQHKPDRQIHKPVCLIFGFIALHHLGHDKKTRMHS